MSLVNTTPFTKQETLLWTTFGPKSGNVILDDHDRKVNFRIVNDDQLIVLWAPNATANIRQGLINISGDTITAQSKSIVFSGTSAPNLAVDSIPGSSPKSFIMYAQDSNAGVTRLWINSVSGNTITKYATYTYGSATDRGTGVIMNTSTTGTVAMGDYTTDSRLILGRVNISGGTTVSSISPINTIVGLYPQAGSLARIDNTHTLYITRNLSTERMWASSWLVDSSVTMLHSTNISTTTKSWVRSEVQYMGRDTNDHYVYAVTYQDATGFNYIQLITVNYTTYQFTVGTPYAISGGFGGQAVSLRPILAPNNQIIIFAGTTTRIYQADLDTRALTEINTFTDGLLGAQGVDGYPINSLNIKLIRTELPGYCRTFY